MSSQLGLFQFYNSPIKTNGSREDSNFPSWFQFYNSPIKTVNQRIERHLSTQFQFYNSPIKKSTKKKSSKIEEKGFNSTIVRLKQAASISAEITQRRFQFYNSPIKTLPILNLIRLTL